MPARSPRIRIKRLASAGGRSELAQPAAAKKILQSGGRPGNNQAAGSSLQLLPCRIISRTSCRVDKVLPGNQLLVSGPPIIRWRLPRRAPPVGHRERDSGLPGKGVCNRASRRRCCLGGGIVKERQVVDCDRVPHPDHPRILSADKFAGAGKENRRRECVWGGGGSGERRGKKRAWGRS